MHHFTSWYLFLLLASQVVFLIIVTGVRTIAGLNDIQTGYVGQVLVLLLG